MESRWMHLKLISSKFISMIVMYAEKILEELQLIKNGQLQSIYLTQNSYPSSPWLCVAGQGFAILASGADRCLIHLEREKVIISISWGFALLMPHASNIFSEVTSLWFLKSQLRISLGCLSRFVVILIPFDVLHSCIWKR